MSWGERARPGPLPRRSGFGHAEGFPLTRLASNFSKHGVLLYGTVRLAPWGPDDKAMYVVFNTVHVGASYVLVALVAMHVAAAAYHALRRDGVFQRMWPRIGAA